MENANPHDPWRAEKEGSTPLERLQNFFSFMTVRVNPGEQVIHTAMFFSFRKGLPVLGFDGEILVTLDTLM
jgi:hypothetical protein